MGKESCSWIVSWCDQILKDELPRVLLIGDSITNGYQSFVREELKEVAYVDHLCLSYAIDQDIYFEIVKSFIKDEKYSLIHFNNGLHGIDIDKETYQRRVTELINSIKDIDIIMVSSTVAYKEGNETLDEKWQERLDERNSVVKEIADAKGYKFDDLYDLSVKMKKEYRYEDGIHYVTEGYKIFAQKVASCIKDSLKYKK